MKRFFTILIVLFLLFSSTPSGTSSANTLNLDEYKYYDPSFGAYVVAFDLDNQGNPIYLTPEQVLSETPSQEFVESPQETDLLREPIGGRVTKYTQTSSGGFVSATGYQVSGWTDVSYSTAYVSTKITVSSGWNATFTAEEKNAIKMVLGYNWERTASSEIGFYLPVGYLKKGQSAAIGWKPSYNWSEGTVVTRNALTNAVISSKYVYTSTPKILDNGVASGHYYIIYGTTTTP